MPYRDDTSTFEDSSTPLQSMFFDVARSLAVKGKGDYTKIDYTILSVVVTTLGLIIIVELVQHKLDHKAAGRPFFKTVLEAAYHELATLGIVEFFIFIIKKYYKDLNPGIKDTFADVHFMLFYAALFNAFQSVITALFTRHVSHRLWVKTEQLELDHYVEIREEFERVDALLYGDDPSHTPQHYGSGASTNEQKRRTREDSNLTWTTDTPGNFAGYSVLKLRKSLTNFFRFLRNPVLYRRHSDLLMQVRFHELRVHFLKQNDLPLKLHVSDYLRSSELEVLCKLVHISPFAWLLLIFAMSILYFLMGMVVDVTNGDLGATGDYLTGVFLGSMIAGVLVSLLILSKMQWIFGRIMRMKLTADGSFRTGKQSQRADKEISSQEALFWGNNPKYISVLLQFMQFGFAIALAIILVFSDDIDVKGAPLPLYAYVLIVLCCYAAYVMITAQVIPRFTLCTCLGQMVNHKRLSETLADYYLNEAKRKQAQAKDDRTAPHKGVSLVDNDSVEATETKSLSTSVRSMLRSAPASTIGKSKSFEDLAMSTTILAELVETDTKQLRSTVSQRELSIQAAKQGRRDRRKAMSEGVAVMRSMGDKESNGLRTTEKDGGSAGTMVGRQNRRKSLSAEGCIQEMRQGFSALNTHNYSTAATDVTAAQAAQEPPKTAADQSLPQMGMLPGSVHIDTSAMKSNGGLEESVSLDSDDHSDVDDIPDVDFVLKHHFTEKHDEPTPTVEEMVRNYFESRRYHIVSAVFGTMLCFFTVGKRVEGMLLKTGVLKDLHNTWNLSPMASFYLEMAFLCCFLFASVLLLLLYYPQRTTGGRQRGLFVSGILDIVISGSCLALLIVAEVQRCCSDDEELSFSALGVHRQLSEGCCEAFGSRTYGGIGVIEPFTSLIALRIFRFPLAMKLMPRLDKMFGWGRNDTHLAPQTAGPSELNPLDPLFDRKTHREKYRNNNANHHSDHHSNDHSNDHSKHDLAHETGTVVDLWKHAIAEFPDIAEKYGQFSGELLQAMLGLDVAHVPKTPPPLQAPEPATAEKLAVVPSSTTAANVAVPTSSTLSIKPSKSDTSLVTKDLPPIKEAPIEDSPAVSRRKSSNVPKQISIKNDSISSNFVAPNSRLLRSMRRADRKLLPLLNTWTPVDVVMTKHEIVYLDAHDLPEQTEAMSKALAATKGGKGLRLRDVVAGRRVVGHLEIKSIDSIHVERILPHDEHHLDASIDVSAEEEVAGEFWKSDHQSMQLSRASRWQRIKEDRVKIHSVHGMLYLRFYSDLEDFEANLENRLQENEQSGKLAKNNALLWCQTVARLCGADQLKQRLPHFGSGDSEELRDYLEIVNPNEGHAEHFQTQFNRLRNSITLGARERLPHLPHIRQHRLSSAEVAEAVEAVQADHLDDSSENDAGSWV